MIRHPPRSTLTDTLFPYTTLFRSRTVRLGDAVEQRLGTFVAVRSAGGHAQWRFRRHARAQRDIGLPVAAERALPARAVPQRAGHRRLDHSEQDLAVLDQGDVDGEPAVALDELARAVPRVTPPPPRPAAPHRRGEDRKRGR